MISFILKIGGYYYVDDLLRRPGFSQYTEHDVRDVVRSCNKQRFKLQDEGGRLKVKATQGHSKEVIFPLNFTLLYLYYI